jgi:hypothetical protein
MLLYSPIDTPGPQGERPIAHAGAFAHLSLRLTFGIVQSSAMPQTGAKNESGKDLLSRTQMFRYGLLFAKRHSTSADVLTRKTGVNCSHSRSVCTRCCNSFPNNVGDLQDAE